MHFPMRFRRILIPCVCCIAAAAGGTIYASSRSVPPENARIVYTVCSANGNVSHSEVATSRISNDTTYVYMSRIDGDTIVSTELSHCIHGRRLLYPIRKNVADMAAEVAGMSMDVKGDGRESKLEICSISGGDFSIPLDAVGGETLPESRVSCRMRISDNGGGSFDIPPITITMKGEVLASEPVKTPAGEFRCIKVRISAKAGMSIFSTTERMMVYIVPQTGMVVREESVTRKGRVTGYMLLESIGKP